MSMQTDFIKSIVAGAQAGQTDYGILASLTIAQACWESGYGKHAPGNNLFGIKAGSSWTGAKQLLWTKEYVDGEYISVQAWFRSYATLGDSVKDHSLFLTQNPRYSNIIGETDILTALQNIQKDGYATDPNYASQLMGVVNSYNLTQYDTGTYSGGVVPAVEGDRFIRQLQEFLNAIGVKDNKGRALIVDGRDGVNTQQAKANAISILKSLLL